MSANIRFNLILFVLAAMVALVGCSSSGDSGGSTPAAAPASGSASSGAKSVIPGGGDGPVAEVAGQAISWDELDTAAADQLAKLKSQAYDIRKRALDQLIDTRLLEAEAAKRGVTVEELTKAEITDKIAEPSDEEAKAFFDKNPPRGGRTYEDLKDRVKAYMKRQNEQEARQNFIASLRKEAKVKIHLQPLRFEVGWTDANPAQGDPNTAPVVIVEFSEFQCPYCSRVLPTMAQVKEEYGDKVAVVFRDFPLPMHKEAPKAAEAAHCAQDQGKFWEMHDVLFQNQRALTDSDLKGYAAGLGIDEAAFAKCLDSGSKAEVVAQDKIDGAKAGVTGTPAFFINGRFLNGARPFESFKEIIDAELEAKGLL